MRWTAPIQRHRCAKMVVVINHEELGAVHLIKRGHEQPSLRPRRWSGTGGTGLVQALLRQPGGLAFDLQDNLPRELAVDRQAVIELILADCRACLGAVLAVDRTGLVA